MFTPQYVAGLFDGEGTVSIIFQKRRIAKTTEQKICGFTGVVKVSNTFQPILEELKIIYGGRTSRCCRATTPQNKDVFEWAINGRDLCLIFLNEILPFVIIKKEQVKLGIQYFESVGLAGSRLDQKTWDLRIDIYNKMKALNRRGKDKAIKNEIPKEVPRAFRPSERFTKEQLAARMEDMRAGLPIRDLNRLSQTKQAVSARKRRKHT